MDFREAVPRSQQSERTKEVLRSLTDLASLLGRAGEECRNEAHTPPRQHSRGSHVWSEPSSKRYKEAVHTEQPLRRAQSVTSLRDASIRPLGGFTGRRLDQQVEGWRAASGPFQLEDLWREQRRLSSSSLMSAHRSILTPPDGDGQAPADSSGYGDEHGKPTIVEREVVQEKDVVVEVPEVHFHSIRHEIPRVTLQEIEQPVEVPEVHWIEDVRLLPKHVVEEEVIEVPQTIVREVAVPVFRDVQKVTEEVVEVEVPLPVPRFGRIVERPRLDVKEKRHFVTGQCDVRCSETTVEVPHVLELPQPVLVPKIETRIVQKDVVVPQIESIKKVVPRLEEQIVERPVEIPVIHDQRNIVYKPVWVQPEVGGVLTSSPYGGGQFAAFGLDESVWQRYEEATMYIKTLEEQLEELQAEMAFRQNQLTELSEQLLAQKRRNTEAAQRVQSLQASFQPKVLTTPGRKVVAARGFASEPSRTVSHQLSGREQLEWSFGSPDSRR